ncbi:hypothetical protein KHQ81_04575 [Mycoplasmatota bacterium]|nr:hypothetical protein KHQ81_04575 [Mycoplasmatota bacterium]
MKSKKEKKPKKRGFFKSIFGKSKSKVELNLDAQLDESAVDQSVTEEELMQKEMDADEEEANLQKPKSVISREHIFVKDVDPKKYCDDLYSYLQDNGLSVNMNNVREMFASMAATKLIIVKSEDPILSQRFVELFSDFIGAYYTKDKVKPNLELFDDLYLDNYRFKKFILKANHDPNKINIMSLRDVKLDTLEQCFDKVLEYAWNPLLACNIESSIFSFVKEMPINTWFMVIPKDSNDTFMSETLGNSAITLELNAKTIEPKEEVYENEKKLSYEFMTNLLLEGYEKFYIKEAAWKKVDKVEEYLKEYSTFTLDNRMFRQLERYTSTYLMFGGDEYEAMDSVLYAKLLRVISILKINIDQDSEKGLFQLFEKLYGLENLTRSKTILKEIQEMNR